MVPVAFGIHVLNRLLEIIPIMIIWIQKWRCDDIKVVLLCSTNLINNTYYVCNIIYFEIILHYNRNEEDG